MALIKPFFFKPRILRCVEEIKSRYPKLELKIQFKGDNIYLKGKFDNLVFKEISLIVKNYFPESQIFSQLET
ncbi:MAG: hypothetical protein M1505_02595 [Patescibacteria group bacterium]|nr:hypothetical protein [Patescibacteria group bacterium]